MYFKDIPFKEVEKQFLRKQVQENRIPHAQLFLGKEGSGALPLALAFISYIYCSNKTIDGDSCGSCTNCKQSHGYVHPDWHMSFPVVKSESKKREDTISDDFLVKWREALRYNPDLTISEWQEAIGAGNSKPNINVKECQSIMQKLSLGSYGEGPKVLLLWLPEYLGREGNRLLKLIEEPTPDTLIIMIAHNGQQILNTILSRCQLVKVLPYTLTEIETILINHHGVSQAQANQYAALSEGNINVAISLCQGEERNMADLFVQWMRLAYKGDALEILSWANDMSSESKDGQIRFLQYGLHFLRELLFWNLSGKIPNLSPKELPTAEKMKTIIDPQKTEHIANVLEEAIISINRNGNMKIIYTADTITIGDILKNIPKNSIKQVKFVG